MRQSLGWFLLRRHRLEVVTGHWPIASRSDITIQGCDQVKVDLRIEEGLDGWSDIVGMIMILSVAVAIMVMMVS
jgi:hypothetical protein